MRGDWLQSLQSRDSKIEGRFKADSSRQVLEPNDSRRILPFVIQRRGRSLNLQKLPSMRQYGICYALSRLRENFPSPEKCRSDRRRHLSVSRLGDDNI